MKNVSIFIIASLFFSFDCLAQDSTNYLRDRGSGIATSMFGTYINKGEFIIYPFVEFYYDKDAEYKPAELGYLVDEDYFGKFHAIEGLIFLSYGISDRLAIEMEAAVIDATQEKSKDDISNMPSEISESGLGDVEGQLRYRFVKEDQKRPELFSYFETVVPLQKDKVLIGTQDWEFKLGAGAIKGFSFGTITVRAAVEYDRSEDKVELGEMAIEYLRRVSDFFRFYVGVEGTQDEVEGILDLQFHFTSRMFARVNTAFGITPKATDFAPEAGILFYLNKK